MVYMISDSPAKPFGMRNRTFCYDDDNSNDTKILEQIDAILSTQPTCFNCENFCREGCFGGYQAASCKLHGCIEAVDHPHHDADGSKCEDYRRR